MELNNVDLGLVFGTQTWDAKCKFGTALGRTGAERQKPKTFGGRMGLAEIRAKKKTPFVLFCCCFFASFFVVFCSI